MRRGVSRFSGCRSGALASRPMEQRLSLVTLGVADLERATRFYEALGWQPNRDADGVTFFQTGGLVIALWGRDELAADSVVVDSGGWGGVTLAQNVRSRDRQVQGELGGELAIGKSPDAVRSEQPDHCGQRLLHCDALRAFFRLAFLRSVTEPDGAPGTGRTLNGATSVLLMAFWV